MGENEGGGSVDTMQRLRSSFGTSSSSLPKQPMSIDHQFEMPHLTSNVQNYVPMGHFRQSLGSDGGKRSSMPPSYPNQMPPISPYSQIPVSLNQQSGSNNMGRGPSHSRSFSQPTFFSLDLLPPLSPSTYKDSQSTLTSDQVSGDVSVDNRDGNKNSLLPPSSYTRGGNGMRVGESLPPRKAHRRSNSEIPFGFSNVLQSSPPLIPSRSPRMLERTLSGGETYGAAKPVQLVKNDSSWKGGGDNCYEGMGERKFESEVIDDLFSACMNLDNIDTQNASGTDEKNRNENHEDLDSRASGTKTNGGEVSDNEVESNVKENSNGMLLSGRSALNQKREGIKRSAGGDIAPTTRHYRSISMDSFMENMHLGDESPKLTTFPGNLPGQLSPSNSMDKTSSTFSLEFGNSEFSGAELKKIMANEKLSEIALADPKRAKRILANRQSAARSKERKTRYISELEIKVQTLQTEATTLSTQLTLLQQDSAGLTSQNSELKFRLQAMEQQAQLRDALNEALTAEVHRLKLATQEQNGESRPTNCMGSQHPINSQMFQMSQQQQQNNMATKQESDK